MTPRSKATGLISGFVVSLLCAGLWANPPAPRAAQWKEKLGLTDGQAQKLEAVMKEQREQMQALREKMKEDLKKLEDQLKAKAPDQDIQATLDRLHATHQSINAEQDKAATATSGFLSATQRGKLLLEKMKHAHEMHGAMGRNGPGGAPGNAPGASMNGSAGGGTQ